MQRWQVLSVAVVLASTVQTHAQSKHDPSDKFRQLEEILPTPNDYRTASGAPGHEYWQQRADYAIDVELDDARQRIVGSERITYHNNSPDPLTYLWLQLDQNHFARDSDTALTETAPEFDRMGFAALESAVNRDFDGGDKISAVKDDKGAPLKYAVVKTMMRIDLPAPLAPGKAVTFAVDWSYNITNQRKQGGRSGYEFFPKDGNYLYEIAQWFPRMAAYNDVSGWQHKQFLGAGEFTLEFGDYTVRITAPADHVVGATGVLQNPLDVLSSAQRDRLKQAETSAKPVLVVTPQEALQAEKGKATTKKTWVFRAENVRDFGFASSRKFIWDAQGHNVDGNKVMAMSYYPKEGNPLWEKYSTPAIIHTLNIYSRYAFSYPYPVAISVNGPVGGMEYPMICFNGPRPEEDGTYAARTKYGLISVVIHEVGHNFFPMIVNSDERQWTWMDEGLNSFLQYLAEQEWEQGYPSRRGEPKEIVEYMAGDGQVPIMTNSESALQLGNNAYAKPATALNILRETVMGRELFDFAFREYARRWKFKRPMPSDFFRTMEDASGVDLDWFWRGWFYSTDHTDLSIENVRLFNVDTKNPDVEKTLLQKQRDAQPKTLSAQRNETLPKLADQEPDLKDFYNAYDPLAPTARDKEEYQKFVATLTGEEKALLNNGLNFYVVDMANLGGLVMPVIFEIQYADGKKEEMRIPAEIWRRNNHKASKLLVTDRTITQITLDPHLETADVDLSNNTFPRRPVMTRFQLFKNQQPPPNPMQQQEKKGRPTAGGGER
ncbi:MAG: M1 family metallopeptidase [Vicinamibacterales bacterium]